MVSPSTVTRKVSASTVIDGRASLFTMSAFVTPRQSATGTTRCESSSRSARPSSTAAGATKAIEVCPAVRPNAPNIGRGSTGCGVGIEALASPIAAQAITPPFTTTWGRTPKNRGS